MKDYTSPQDKTFAADIIHGAPAQAKSWLAFDKAVEDSVSVIPAKYRELIAIGVALTTQCPYCLERHTLKARELNATQEEIAETIMIAAALRSGAALGYGLLTMKLFKEERQ